MWQRPARLALLALLLAAGGEASAPACPSCREALARSDGQPGQAASGDLARSFNSSILLMAAMPFVLMGGIVALALRDRATVAPEQEGAP